MATIRQVASLAQVSIASVSRILSNDPTYKVKEETKRKVLDAAAELNYVPSPSYSKKRSSVTKKIGVINNLTVEKTMDSYFSSILSSSSYYFKNNGYELDFVQSQYDIMNKDTLHKLLSPNIKGLIIMETLDGETMNFIRSKIKHIVGIDTGIDDIDNVRYNRYDAGWKAVQHLIDNGHRKIAYIGSFSKVNALNYPGRFDAYKKIMESNGLTVDPAWIIDCEWHRQICYDKTRELLKLHDRPTALFVASDHMAMASMSALHQSGLSIPDDMSIVGISDIEASKYLNPPLTTVAIPQKEIGEIAANTLLQRINGDKTVPKQIFVPTRLITRNSVKPLNSNQHS